MSQERRFDLTGIEFCCTIAPSPHMLDYNGHLNIAYYGTFFEDAARSLFSRLDLSKAYRERSDCALFAVEMHMVFRREVLEGEAVSIYCRMLDFDGRKVHCMFFLVKTREQVLAAVQEILYLHIDLGTRRVTAVPEPQAGRMLDLLHKHERMPAPVDAGRRVGLRRRRSSASNAGANV